MTTAEKHSIAATYLWISVESLHDSLLTAELLNDQLCALNHVWEIFNARFLIIIHAAEISELFLFNYVLSMDAFHVDGFVLFETTFGLIIFVFT